MYQWINSPGHRETLMNANAGDMVVVGVYVDKGGAHNSKHGAVYNGRVALTWGTQQFAVGDRTCGGTSAPPFYVDRTAPRNYFALKPKNGGAMMPQEPTQTLPEPVYVSPIQTKAKEYYARKERENVQKLAQAANARVTEKKSGGGYYANLENAKTVEQGGNSRVTEKVSGGGYYSNLENAKIVEQGANAHVAGKKSGGDLDLTSLPRCLASCRNYRFPV